ncbi:E3 ubiquitin-protein ligase PUB23-like [Dioscorea cayenensis subsp. rotundata]|uniref:U-box domain-containing protein n=1 Tax=Dioscorea cayennensis subsp. rotundata TaxID=55577 RepID=A0AB40APF0_DIOCR|nr:E3 ubiquitin-protein ligase PUB23-like [Dioscorea cayenensis subsp. rotundata]
MEIEVPSYFLCPITLQLMRDPVTLATGITYDRESIERWMFTEKHWTCPVTKQELPENELITPNHTLRRLIQAWCTVNASAGVERFPTPRPPVNKSEILQIIGEAQKPQALMECLRRLRMIVLDSERNRRCVEESGAVEFLASIVDDFREKEEEEEGACDEALYILHCIHVSEQGLIKLISNNGGFIESLGVVMSRTTNYQTRVHAVLILKSLVEVIAPVRLMAVQEEVLREVVKVLSDQVSCQATKAALKVIAEVCPWGRNRIKAVKAGAVPVLIELLLEEPEKRECEMILVVLELLCCCAEGRAEVVGHAAGIAVVSKKVLRVSHSATNRAVRVLYLIAKYAAAPAVLQEMLQVGAVSKLCSVLQVDCGMKTKEKALEILKVHYRVWKNSPCVTYP